jgi:pilus assembly protein Flp/PilA
MSVPRTAGTISSSPYLSKEQAMFSRVISRVVNFLKAEDGPTAVEYAVMLALIIVVCITAIQVLGTNTNNTFSYVSSQVAGTSS